MSNLDPNKSHNHSHHLGKIPEANSRSFRVSKKSSNLEVFRDRYNDEQSTDSLGKVNLVT